MADPTVQALIAALASLKQISDLDAALAERNQDFQSATARLIELKLSIEIAASNLSNLKIQNAAEIAAHQDQLSQIKQEIATLFAV